MSRVPLALAPTIAEIDERLLADLNTSQREAVLHAGTPLLILAGAGTGKTTVITRRIAYLIAKQHVHPEEVLALTFTDKASAEMEERVDLLLPYGYVEVAIRTFHAFGDRVLREHALKAGRSPNFRVLSKAEQLVFLEQHLFDLPLQEFRPLNDPPRFLEALITVFARAKDEAVGPAEFTAYAQQLQEEAAQHPEDEVLSAQARRMLELGHAYAAYQRLLQEADAVDFGDQVFLALQVLEQHPDVRAAVQQRVRCVLVDEFQDTNYAQFRLLQVLADSRASITVVADDDQSIYKWRGAAISNVVKFLEHYQEVRTVVLTENYRSSQAILDCAYRLIRFNDPDRLEVRQGIDKRLVARATRSAQSPHVRVFDTVSSEADWVARTIREAADSGARRPSEFAILVRSNREADVFLRALNVAGVPWQFSGASGLFAREESKMLLSCLRVLADAEDSISWYHVASSPLYRAPMQDVASVLAHAERTHESFSGVLQRLGQLEEPFVQRLTEAGRQAFGQLAQDVLRLQELSREQSAGQVLYRWLADRDFLAVLSRGEREEEAAQLQTVGRFFNQLRRIESLVGSSLPEIVRHLELFQALGNEPIEDDDAWADRVHVLTLHKAKGLEFPVVFLVGLVQDRFPTRQRRDQIELPEPLIKDLLPAGNYHLQEERRLFYVGMTRAKEELYLTCAYDYGGKTIRKVSQFVLEALNLAMPNPPAKVATPRELIERSAAAAPRPLTRNPSAGRILRIDAHGLDDYRTCPLKYRYTHVLKIPVMSHHVVVYGAALHKAVEAYFKRQLAGAPMQEGELLEAFEQAWRSEGFLTREHEAMRLKQGRETLQRFYARQQTRPESPSFIEEKFRFPVDDVLVVGRWDRVDQGPEGAVIIDYKSSDVRDRVAADRRARESVQMLLYALAWRALHGELPHHVELRFLEADLIGQAQFTEKDLERAVQMIHRAAKGIRSSNFQAEPQEHTCQWCAYQSICAFAFQTR